MMQARPPGTTAHAVLGLIAAEPASAYDLATRMRITYAYFWPSARSHVFAEVKRLAALGWVRGEDMPRGGRERTVYSITPSGEAALRAWLDAPCDHFSLEIDGLVRLYLARFGARAQLDRALASMEAESERMLRIAGEIVPAYLAGTPPPPADRLEHRALLIDFLAGFADFVHAWARRSRAEVARWPGSTAKSTRARAMATLRRAPRIEASGTRRGKRER